MRDGEFFPVASDERGSYVMNSKDLCLLPYLGEVIKSGVSSLKIEGRMKSVNYVAGVVKVYRAAIDSFCENPDAFEIRGEWLDELDKVAHRPYTTGFFLGDGKSTEIYSTSKPKRSANFLGIVRNFDARFKSGGTVGASRNRLQNLNSPRYFKLRKIFMSVRASTTKFQRACRRAT